MAAKGLEMCTVSKIKDGAK